jgi:RNA polymerase sigma-70 factor, ECF subfamily
VNHALIQPADTLVDHLFRNRAGQMVAYLTRLLGPEHLDLAEEVVQEALLKALQNWPYSGIPQNPAGWLFRVARNAALDAIRHRTLAGEKNVDFAAQRIRAAEAVVGDDTQIEEQLRDDELRMVLMCCHPALPRDARVALSLKTVGGFSTREIARAFLSDEPTIAQRLVRAKRQIRETGIAFELPSGDDLALRLDSALEVIYLMFNEGYTAQSGEDLVRQDLCGEALRLGRLVATSSVGTPQTHALVALIAFQAARLPARVDSAGELVLLEDQDRSLWDQKLVALGFRHFSQCAEGTRMSAYHVQAAVAAVYAGVQSAADINWPAILSLYDQLMEISPSAIVALNRAVAVSRVHGAQAALAVLRPLAEDRSLRNYYLLPAVHGRLLLDLGYREAAADCLRQALERPCSAPEKRFLERKLKECVGA